MQTQIDELARRVASASRVTVLTGAGVSAASGIPTFRGAGGLWRERRAEDLATPQAFARDPDFVWQWYDWRRSLVANTRPNAAHHVLAAWSHRWSSCTVVTQNVDDLHLRAGTRGLVRLHGSLWELRCWSACGTAPWRDERASLRPLPPLCRSCGGLARPGVVWFGESLDAADVDAAARACDCDVFVSVGTSAVVYPAAGLLELARRRGAFTAEVNADATPATGQVDVAIQGAAEDVLPRVDEELR